MRQKIAEKSQLEISNSTAIIKIHMNQEQFNQQSQYFLNLLFADLEKAQIQLALHWSIDHLCFRCDSHAHYLLYQQHFQLLGKLLIESEVGGRLISTYKLHRPVQFRHWQIPLVELPAPKTNQVTELGFEHIEVVCDLSFEQLANMYGHLVLDKKGLNKTLNPDLEIVLGARNIKFHHQSLEQVIAGEQNKPN
jgi:predicted metalloenzyme YecM